MTIPYTENGSDLVRLPYRFTRASIHSVIIALDIRIRYLTKNFAWAKDQSELKQLKEWRMLLYDEFIKSSTARKKEDEI